MSHPEMSRDLLLAAGGHVEFKMARDIHRGGNVQSAKYENGVLSGELRIGGKLKKISMEIFSPTHMENKCFCPMARREGRVCSHIIAVGLEVVEPLNRPEKKAPEETIKDRWPKLSATGKPLSLQVMLPLDVESAWKKGAVMIGFGAELEGEEMLLAAIPNATTHTYLLDAHDEELWRTLKDLFPGEAPGMVNLSPSQFDHLLEGLIGHPRVQFGKKEAAQIHRQGPRPTLEMSGERVRVRKKDLGNLGRWQLDGTGFQPLALGLPKSHAALLSEGLRVSAAESRWVLGQLEHWFDVPDALWNALPEEGTPEITLHLEGSFRHLDARLEFRYADHLASCSNGEAQLAGDTGLLTSLSKERAAKEWMHAWGFDELGKGAEDGKMALRERDQILKFHAFADFPSTWTVIKGERYRNLAEKVVAIRPEWEWGGEGNISQGQDWFTLESRYQAGGEELKREQVQQMLRMGQVEHAMRGDQIGVLHPEQIEEVHDTLTDSDATQSTPGIFEINAQQAAFLRASARDFGMAVSSEEAKPELDLPDHLRPYQADGVRWMHQLSEMGMGGILADDMGLGKTLQCLSFIQLHGGRALVVCPSSLVSNWANEVRKWTPKLSHAEFVGNKRGDIPEVDILITSYAILRRDADKFHAEAFDVAILDEAQQIKNPESQTSKAAHGLQASHRIAVTGTPVENSLQDLWSILHFALPGYLGPRKAFVERFEKALRGGKDPALARRLARRLKPVVLRRLKGEVAADLPDRIEQVRYCELTPKQASIYAQLLKESRSQVDQAEDAKKRMIALTALLRLRQACCDLRLLPGLQVDDADAGIKLDELEQLLEEALAGGHRVLVFSQFVQLLQGIVPMLAGKGWDFAYLDGNTRNRAEVVERFQQGNTPVFLISLKAGGVGLNLTAADTVIHLDPWWNPAVEAQATDRAHRIGQKQVVTSYKFITRGTVEEKILALQEEKKTMMEAALDAAGTLVPGLEDDELLGLFG